MNKIKNLKKLMVYLFVGAAFWLVAAPTDQVLAADNYLSLELGSVVKRDDGTITIDWRKAGVPGSIFTGTPAVDPGPWRQTTLSPVETAPGTYNSGFSQYGEGQLAWHIKNVNPQSLRMDIAPIAGDSNTRIIVNGMQVFANNAITNYTSVNSITQATYEHKNPQDPNNPGGGGGTTTNPGGGGGGECGVQGGTSVIKCGDGDPIQEMILYFTSFFFAGVGVVSIIGIIIGGVVYITAGGDAAKTKQGITYITNAVIALVVFIFLFMLLNFMVPGGFFNNAGFEMEPPSPNIDNIDPEDHQICNGPNCYSPY